MAYELELDGKGWMPVEAVLEALRAERSDWQGLTADDIAEMMGTASKRRYEMADGRIRALYGHIRNRCFYASMQRMQRTPASGFISATRKSGWPIACPDHTSQ